jgi:hypothetical protein
LYLKCHLRKKDGIKVMDSGMLKLALLDTSLAKRNRVGLGAKIRIKKIAMQLLNAIYSG